MKHLIHIILLMPLMALAQNNLLDTSTWSIGSGSVTGFTAYGTSQENVRELGTDPFGNQSILWKGIPDGSSDYREGGWYATYIAIDPSKTYRFTVWVKKSNSFDGTIIFKSYIYDSGSNHSGTSLNGTSSTNPIFQSNDVPELDKWYLYVGFIHGSSYQGTVNIGGVYDPASGNQVLGSTDYKFTNSAVYIYQNSSLLDSGNTSDAVYFFDPTIYEVNGQEPTISELLNPSGGPDTQAPTAPVLSSTGHTATTVGLSWSGATDNVGVTQYKIFKDGVLEATLGNVATYQVTGLSANTAYSLTATALDAAGNESTVGNAISVTTDGSGGSPGSTVWSESGSVASYAGNVAVGTATVPTGYRMAVDGKLLTEEVRVKLSGDWPDYVFKEGYDLPTLDEIQKHIDEKGHLPNIPSAEEVKENGIELGEMNKLLLEKIEELTLYILELKADSEREINLLRKEIQNLKNHKE